MSPAENYHKENQSAIPRSIKSEPEHLPAVVHASQAVLQLERLSRVAPRRHRGSVEWSISMLRSIIASGDLEMGR